ncbi:FHA domain-containing protein [Shimia sagamensis]|uniref:FHA domain-containing protein n=1 Tax=Shimia sagamensis TaxID=1566352 RepID=A0ABY1PDB7_9RHOB|nr:FHA domain-containing protein [Shimia sagamensis]SMP30989.1 FHA domain-containing protein [Shimia sagamensis]
MRFIRDIIAEKSQAAGQNEAAALRYPLRLRDQDRADAAPDATPQMNIEAEAPPTPEAQAAQFVAPQPPEEDKVETPVDLSAISAALTPEPPVQTPAPAELDFAEELPAQSYEAAAFDFDKPADHEAPPDPFADLMAAQEAVGPPQAPEPQHSAQPDGLADPSPVASAEAPAVALMPQAEAATAPAEPEVDLAALQANMAASKPTTGRGSKGRVKTRLLGFSAPASQAHDPMSQTQQAATSAQAQFPVGWLVVVDGPGKGASFSLHDGLTQIGRGEGQTVRLDFGDNTISRENHAAIAFDGEQGRFFFGHGGKTNLVRLNGRPVLSTEDLQSNSIIRIGETTLRFVALCGGDFAWGNIEAGHDNLG